MILGVIVVIAVGMLWFLSAQVNEINRDIRSIVQEDVFLAPAGDAWTRSANFTTCDQWLTEMTTPQRTAMARDLLPIFRVMVDSAAGSGAELSASFAAAIHRTCSSREIADYGEYFITAAATLAFMETDRFQP